MNPKKILFTTLGCISFWLGAIGSIFPVLPTVPFLLLAAWSFARSSDQLSTWFRSTKLYKENLESYVTGKGMTRQSKVRVMVTVTLLMSIGFIMMHAVPVGRMILACVWALHVLYFVFGIKTIRTEVQEARTA